MKRFGFACLLFVFCFSFSSAQISITGITATPHPDNVLRYDIDFNLSPAATAYVEYGYWNGSDSVWQQTDVHASATQHSIAAIGLHPQEDYDFRVMVVNPSGLDGSGNNSFTTASLPSGVGFSGVDSAYMAPGAGLEGYFMVSTREPNPKKLSQIYDRAGDLLWYEEMPGDPAPAADQLCQHVRVTDQQSIFFLECGRILEKSFSGEVIADIDVHALNPDWYPHHSAFRNRDGNITALIAVVDTVDKTSVGGSANAIVVAPGILEVDDQGSLVWFWSAFDRYNPLNSPAPGGYWVPKFGAEAIDWMHPNSLLQDLDGNYMTTFRDESQVVKISRITGNTLWTCGPGGNIDIMVPDSFFTTASVGLANASNYMMMDLTSKDTVSRAIDWWIDWGYSTPTFMIDRQYVMPSAYFSPEDGSTARLANNNTFVASSKGGAFEFDLSSNLLWFAHLDTSLGHAYYVDDLYARAELEYSGQTLFCITDTLEPLVASPADGYWSGPGVVSGNFDPNAAGQGMHTLYYQYGPDTLAVDVMVDADPNCAVAVDPAMAWNLHFTAFPNPFDDRVTLCYALVRKTFLKIDLYALDGREIGTVFSGTQTPGDQALQLDLSQYNLPEGPVLLRMRTTDGGSSSRMLLRHR